MAGERRGVLYETITNAALKKAVALAGISAEVWWNETPTGMSIIPDFTVGVNKDAPEQVILVTASGAARNSEMKSWRNLGEMQEVKAQLPTIPIVINLYFESEVKSGIGAAMPHLFDSTIFVDEQPYFPPLHQWVQDHLGMQIPSHEARQMLLQDSIVNDMQLADAIDALADDLCQALTQRKTELDTLWQLMRADYLQASTPPKARQTYVRRGLAKLMVIEPAIRQILYKNFGQLIPSDQLADYLFELEFFTRAIGGGRLTDTEIASVIQLLGGTTCEDMIQNAPGNMAIWVMPLQNLDLVKLHVDFVQAHYAQIIAATGLKYLLAQCYNNPAALSGDTRDNNVWLYEIIVSLLKAKSKKLQGYGLAQLAQDTETPEFGEGGFLIPPFVQRTKLLTDSHLTALGKGLAGRFANNVKAGDLPVLRETVTDWVIKENLEDRLIPYRNFEPLVMLLLAELDKRRMVYQPKVAYEGWINEYAAVGKKSATTPFIRVKNTLIHWKSSHGGHANDKTKELSGRARNVKYQYHRGSKTFSRRDGVDKLALIVDGDWSDRNLKTLADSGWDIIVYPDELDKLINALV